MPSLEDIPEDDIEAIATAEATIEEYEKDKEEWWFKLGIYYGTLIYLILYTPDDWSDDHYNPTDEEFRPFKYPKVRNLIHSKITVQLRSILNFNTCFILFIILIIIIDFFFHIII